MSKRELPPFPDATSEVVVSRSATKPTNSRVVFLGFAIVVFLGFVAGLWQWTEYRSQLRRRAALAKMSMIPPFRSISQHTLFDWFTKMAPAPPTFATVQHSYAAWYQQPTSSMYGGRVGVWLVQDAGKPITHLLVTGTAHTQTQQALVRLLYTMSGLESVESEASFVNSGIASFTVDLSCPTDTAVEEYLSAQHKWLKLWQDILNSPQGWRSRFLEKFRTSITELETKPTIQKYLRCQREKTGKFSRMIRGLQWLQETTGLIQLHTIPSKLWKTMQKTWDQHLRDRDNNTLSFAQELKQTGHKQGIAPFPVYDRQQQRAVSFRLTRKAFAPEAMQQAVQLAMQEWKHRIPGILRQQMVFVQSKQKAIQQEVSLCRQWQEESGYDKRKVSLQEFCLPDGTCRTTQIPDMSRMAYCQFYLPEQVKRMRSWFQDTETWLQQVTQTEAMQTLESWIESALWDAMLRGIPFSGFQYTRAFREWSDKVRDHVWFTLYQDIVKRGLSVHVLTNPTLVFQVKREGQSMVVLPFWIVDLARSSWTWTPKDRVPQLTIQPLPSLETSDISLHQDATKRFGKLQDILGIQGLRHRGALFATFADFWTHHLPLKLSLTASPTVGLRAKQLQDLAQVDKQFRWYQKLRKAANSMDISTDPESSQVHLWLQSMHRTSQSRQTLARILGKIEAQSGRWRDYDRLQTLLALTQEAEQTLSSIHSTLQEYETSRVDTPSLRLFLARMYYEQGKYRVALETMLYPKVALGFYHRELTWKVTSNDWRGNIAKMEADRIFQTVVIKANATGHYTQPVLVVEGMSLKAAEDLVEAVGKAELKTFPSEKASEQLLALPVEVSAVPKQVFQQFESGEMFDMLLQDMVHACHPPWKQKYPPTTPCQHPYFEPKTIKDDDNTP